MGSLSCPLCCGRLFQNMEVLKNRLLTWNKNIFCPVCLLKFNTITELAHHLDEESCKKVRPTPTPNPARPSRIHTVSISPKETNINSVSSCRMPYEVIISDEASTEAVDVTECEQDEDKLVEQWEPEINTEQFQHFCQSCNCAIQGVQEHIKEFHCNEMVVLQTEDGDDVNFLENVNQELDSMSINEGNIDIIVPVTNRPTREEGTINVNNMDSIPKMLVHNGSKNTQGTSTENKNDRGKVLDMPFMSNSKSISDKGTCNVSKKVRHLKVSNKLKETNKLVTSTEISYVRKIVHIEKFWEKQFWEKQSQKALLSLQNKKKLSRTKNEIENVKYPGNSTSEHDHPKQLHNVANEQDGIIKADNSLLNEESTNPDSPMKVLSRPRPKKKIRPRGATFCEVCNLKFKSNRSLLSHIKSHDPNTKHMKLYQKQFQKSLKEPAICDMCNTEFTTHVSLRIHMKMHLPEHSKIGKNGNLVCDVCHMVCCTEQGLRVHYQIHTRDKQTMLNVDNLYSNTSPPAPTLKCKLCSVSFFSNEELKTHWQNHNLENEEKQTPLVVAEETVVDEHTENEGEFFTCGKCGKQVACLLRKEHEKTHLIESRFGCSICNKHFPCETDLSFHVAMHKSDVAAVYECHQCKVTFMTAALLKGHIKRIHSGVNRRFPCGFCGRRFAKPFEKVTHERIHTGEKPFECGVCAMKFRVRSCLRLHERIHTGVRPYSCDQCGKRFRALSNYNHHVRLHSDVRSFTCPICPKAFKTSVALAGHKAIHFKRYACPKCGRRFAVLYAMRAHLNSHSSNVNLKHKCYICGATYVRKYALRDHIATHGVDPIPPLEQETSNYIDSEQVICQ